MGFFYSDSSVNSSPNRIDNVDSLVRNEFRLFFERNILSAYPSGLPVSFVGSIAVVFERQLRLTAESLGVEIGRIVRHPLPLMIEFHKKN